MGHKQGSRAVSVTLDESKKRIALTEDGKIVRVIDLSMLDASQHAVRVSLSADASMTMIMVSVPKDYDLVSIHTTSFIHFSIAYLFIFNTIQQRKHGHCLDVQLLVVMFAYRSSASICQIRIRIDRYTGGLLPNDCNTPAFYHIKYADRCITSIGGF